MSTFELRELYDNLEEDPLRKTKPFAGDFEIAHRLLVHPFASEGQRIEIIERWIKKHQPCLFGRIAVATHRMQFCFVDDQDLFISDQHVEAKIREGLLAWKQRSLRPHPEISVPAHGFMLIIVSDKIAHARPDKNLLNLAVKFREIWGCASSVPAHGEVFWEHLFLQNPTDQSFVKFTFSVDFFAAQGEDRWWQDHRTPGGLAFTANSAGHMRRYREWYEGKGDQREWLLQTAMLTIDYAAETPFGRATTLRPLVGGKPFVERVGCPFADPAEVSKRLQGKDWTRYGGHLHTDHSIRAEFFDDRQEKSPDVQNRNFVQDFVYLYDHSTEDHIRFAAGQIVSREEVIREIGDPEHFTQFSGPSPTVAKEQDEGVEEYVHPEVSALLEIARTWELSPAELQETEK